MCTLYSSSVIIFCCIFLYNVHTNECTFDIFYLSYRYRKKRAYKCRSTGTNSFFYIIFYHRFTSVQICSRRFTSVHIGSHQFISVHINKRNRNIFLKIRGYYISYIAVNGYISIFTGLYIFFSFLKIKNCHLVNQCFNQLKSF